MDSSPKRVDDTVWELNSVPSMSLAPREKPATFEVRHPLGIVSKVWPLRMTAQPDDAKDNTSDTRVVSAPVSSDRGIQVGDVIADKYRVESIIGRGGMGVVVAAEHLQLKETVALKFLLSGGEDEKEFRQRFLREAQVSAKLRGEHVVRLMDFGAPEGAPPYIVMERLQGTDLRETLNHFGKIPIDIALDYIAQACEGVAEAHALGVVHRDLKPSNLFVTKRLDGSDLVKILDFGVSKARASQDVDEELTSAGSVLGSPRYMSPEQLRNSVDVDARSDVWSLGAILYEIICGRPPFKAESTAALCAKILGEEPPAAVRSYRPEVSVAVENAVLRCLARDPNKRTPDVASLVGELADATDHPWLRSAAARVAAVLERRSLRADTGTGSFPGFGSGPRSTLGLSAPSSGKMQTPGPRASSPSVASTVIAAQQEKSSESSRRSPLVLVAMAGILVAGILGIALVTREKPAAPAEAPAKAADSAPVSMSAVPTAVPVAPKPAESTAAPKTSASAAPPPDDKVDKRPEPTKTGRKPPPAGPAPPPAAPAQPSPPKANPLGDRL